MNQLTYNLSLGTDTGYPAYLPNITSLIYYIGGGIYNAEKNESR